MKALKLTVVGLLLTSMISGQTISGKVIDASNDQALRYVNIGVIETVNGCITDEDGLFNFDTKGLSDTSKVRFSSIGFKSHTFSLKVLNENDNIIKLMPEPVLLPEVIVHPKGKLRIVGTNKHSKMAGVCGWGGTEFGRGHEIGTKLELGPSSVGLRSLHIRLSKQSFDTSVFRLHIRNIAKELPSKELLQTEILIAISEEKGWIEIDLSSYNLSFKGDIALSLEWIKVNGVNSDRLMRMNRSKNQTANVLLNIKTKQGCLYFRWGSENKWS